MVEKDIKHKKKRKIFKTLNKKQKIGLGTTSIIAVAAIFSGVYFFFEFQETPEFIFKCGLADGPDSIDPLQNPGPNYANNWLINQIAEGLFDYDQNKTGTPIVSNLALDGTWSPDHLNFTCTLRRNVTFHDRTLFNATAVKWNFERIYRIINTMPYDQIWAWEYAYLTSERKPIINRTEIIDDFTIKFILNQPYVPIRHLLAAWPSYILSPTSTPEDDFIDIRTGKLVGTGPFILDSCEINIQGYCATTDMHANPDYWGGVPSINKVRFEWLDDSERIEGIQSGELSFAEGTRDNETLEIIEINPLNIIDNFTSLGFSYLGMNNNKFNLTMRKAISHAFNYSRFLKDFRNGHSVRVKSPLSREMHISYWGDFDIPYYNITEARKTLKDANWPGTINLTINDNITAGNEWEMMVNNSKPLAIFNFSIIYGAWPHYFVGNLLMENLKQIGVKINLKELANVEWVAKLNNRTLDFFIAGYGPGFLDPVEVIDPMFSNSTNALGNVFNFYDKQVQLWIDAAVIEFDETNRSQLYYNIQERLIEQLYPVVWLDSPRSYQMWRADLRGIAKDGAHLKFVLKNIYSL
ncbi:MAG: ABC transporter substrate-binding protein [Candidatus Thorarchaeota archaeon]